MYRNAYKYYLVSAFVLLTPLVCFGSWTYNGFTDFTNDPDSDSGPGYAWGWTGSGSGTGSKYSMDASGYVEGYAVVGFSVYNDSDNISVSSNAWILGQNSYSWHGGGTPDPLEYDCTGDFNGTLYVDGWITGDPNYGSMSARSYADGYGWGPFTDQGMSVEGECRENSTGDIDIDTDGGNVDCDIIQFDEDNGYYLAEIDYEVEYDIQADSGSSSSAYVLCGIIGSAEARGSVSSTVGASTHADGEYLIDGSVSVDISGDID